MFELAVRASAPRFGGAKEPNDRLAERGGDGHVQQRENSQVPINGMSMERRPPSAEIVESARAFARLVQPDRQRSVSKPGEGAAPEEALQINDPIETLGANPADTLPYLTPI